MAKVFIGVGHGGPDPGAVANGLTEKDMNLVMALKCKEVLESAGVEVGISRLRDEEDRLAEEIAECNAFNPDVAIEVHNNAGGGNGFEVYVQNGKAKSAELARAIEARVKDMGQNSRGLKTKLTANGADWFGWLRQVKAPAVLLEGVFLDSADHEIADTIDEQEAFGFAYAVGVLDYLGLELPFEPLPGEKDEEIAKLRAVITAYEAERNKVMYHLEEALKLLKELA